MRPETDRDLKNLSKRRFPMAYKCLFENAQDSVLLLRRRSAAVGASSRARKPGSGSSGHHLGEQTLKDLAGDDLSLTKAFDSAMKGKSGTLKLQTRDQKGPRVTTEVIFTPFRRNGKTSLVLVIVRRIKKGAAVVDEENRSAQLTSLMRNSAEMIRSTTLNQRLQKMAEVIRENGWRRIVIRAVRGEDMEVQNREDMVTAGLSKEEKEFLWNNHMSGRIWRERFGPDYERFRIGGFYHLPWSDPWVREKFAEGTVPSRLSADDMVDWDPEDLLYAPLRLSDGRIVGVLSIDDPINGKRPTKESLAPLDLFIHQAAVAIENAYLFRELESARNQIKSYAEELERKVEERTQQLVDAQKKLIRAERLAAIGEVAAMVGHDLRNPLTGMTGATYYLKRKLGSVASKKTLEMLEVIEKDIAYSNKIVSDLLEYSREIRLESKLTSFGTLVKDALALVEIPCNVEIVNKSSTRSRVFVDVEKMKRVFVNIIKNAIDAMPSGGKLEIRTKRTEDRTEISIADTGTGMSKEVLHKLWSPLFTTKARGMGFGLPICKRVVETHGGSINVQSSLGKGTTFTISIPLKGKQESRSDVWVNIPEPLLSMTQTEKTCISSNRPE